MGNAKEVELHFTDLGNELLKDLPRFVREYVRAIHNRTSPRTRYEYLKDIKCFLDYAVEKYKWKSVTLDNLATLRKSDFEEYFEHLEHYEKDGVERSNGRVSIKRKMSALRKFFAYLFENSLIPSDEIRKVEMPKLHHKEIVKLDPEEVKSLLTTVEYGQGLTAKELQYHKRDMIRDLAIFLMYLSSGLRVSELAGLDIDDVNLEKRSLSIVRKGGNQSTVYFSDQALTCLKKYIIQRNELKEKVPAEKALFLSSWNRRMSVRNMEVLVKKYCARAGINKKMSPHKLRATFATMLYNLTGDVYLVADILGHQDVATTKEHYADMSGKRKEESRNIVQF